MTSLYVLTENLRLRTQINFKTLTLIYYSHSFVVRDSHTAGTVPYEPAVAGIARCLSQKIILDFGLLETLTSRGEQK